MTEMPIFDPADGFGARLKLRPLVIEDMSDVRYIHASSFRLMAGSYASDEEVSAFAQSLGSPTYSDAVMAAIRTKQIIGAELDSQLVGTGGWTYTDTAAPTARLRWVFVRPLFNDCGIGRRIVSDIELQVLRAGHGEIAVRSTLNAVPFFEHLGYVPTSRGIQQLNRKVNLPVVFMRKVLAHTGVQHLTRH